MNEVPLIGAVYDLPGYEGLRYTVLSRRQSTDDGASQSVIVIFDHEMIQVGVIRWESRDISTFAPYEASAEDPPPLGTIHLVQVREDWRGRGLATALVEIATDVATRMDWCPPRLPATSPGDGHSTDVTPSA